MTSPPPVLAMRGLVKTFGPTRALDDASLVVTPGTVHGLVGQNGAGKSTLIKALAGLVSPEAGSIEFEGKPLDHLSPQKAEQLGIAFIHQDRLLVPTATVGEALFLGREAMGSRFGVWQGSLQRRADEALRHFFGITLPRGALIRDLSTAQQQIVQITRALLAKPRLIIFDEPTAALAKREVESLFAAIAQLKARGLTSIYISHYLAEIERICDVVTIMRNGRDVAHIEPSRTTIGEITRLMVDRDVKDLFPRHRAGRGKPVLSVTGLDAPPAFANVSLAVHRGEVVGLTGLLGSGAKELVQALFGLRPARAGTIEVDGRARRLSSPVAAAQAGLALVPEDRRAQGVALGLSIRENATLASLGQITRLGWLDRSGERSKVSRLIEALKIKASSQDAPVRTLSGGNQQKVVIAKWLARRSDVYVLDEPTVGVDVAAKAEIYRLIAELAEEGAGVLLLSADLDELLGVCDRVLVMHRGGVVGTYETAATSSDQLLAAALTGVGPGEGASHAA
ncbi:sugar ABC transporter [Labrys sp. WJW]|uniref:sugar ABC transporter ATP-binding protein n=1 Tax=Labrys sp. WJW TaxID=1737983 RepID=UPI0008360803|nr:sugar ABC transporter ATP-binding protein [Labrys sp. WJW]OCC03941.1 sugar ABC transporter [Labrys sp. WJW]